MYIERFGLGSPGCGEGRRILVGFVGFDLCLRGFAIFIIDIIDYKHSEPSE